MTRIAKGKTAIQLALAPTKYRPLTRNIVNLARLETGNFKSNLYSRTNNLFSMGVPSKRQSTQDGFILADGRKFATFKTDYRSVLDFIKYLDYFIKKNPATIEELKYPKNFVDWLVENGYNSNPKFKINFLLLS